MEKVKSLEDIKSFCISVGSEFLSNKYINAQYKYDFKCINCGDIFTTLFSNFKRGKYQCPFCNKSKKWEKADVVNWINENRNEYTLVNFSKDKKNSYVKVRYKQNPEVFNILWMSFKNGVTPIGLYSKLNYPNNSLEKIKNDFKKVGLNILNIEDYKNSNTRLICEDDDGYKYVTRYSNCIINNKTPLKFFKNNPFTIKNIKLWTKYNRPEYELISNTYIRNNKKLKFKYNGKFFNDINSKRIFEISLDKFLGYREHPLINISKLERVLIKELNKNKIEFKFQKTFEDCKNKKVLPFDFYLLEYNILIEAQGSLHSERERLKYNNGKHFGGSEGLVNQTKNDLIKQKFCRENNIRLVKIWYYEIHQINKILKYLKPNKEAELIWEEH